MSPPVDEGSEQPKRVTILEMVEKSEGEGDY